MVLIWITRSKTASASSIDQTFCNCCKCPFNKIKILWWASPALEKSYQLIDKNNHISFPETVPLKDTDSIYDVHCPFCPRSHIICLMIFDLRKNALIILHIHIHCPVQRLPHAYAQHRDACVHSLVQGLAGHSAYFLLHKKKSSFFLAFQCTNMCGAGSSQTLFSVVYYTYTGSVGRGGGGRIYALKKVCFICIYTIIHTVHVNLIRVWSFITSNAFQKFTNI